MNHSVLLLNQAHEPLTIVGWKRALTLIFSDKAEVLRYSNNWVNSARDSWNLPSVITLSDPEMFVNPVYSVPKCTKRRIHIRDNFKCVYCGTKCKNEQLTIEHIIPQSKGGETTWKNCVTACKKCNSYKSNMSLDESGFVLQYKPRVPANIFEIYAEQYRENTDWHKYIKSKLVGKKS